MERKPHQSAKAILGRIDKRLKALKAEGRNATDRSISLEATGSPDTIRSIRRNLLAGSQRGISTETIRKLAPPLETSPEWLGNGIGPEHSGEMEHIDSADVLPVAEDSMVVAAVPLLGYVRAGAEAVYLPLHESELDRIPAPFGSTEKTRALEIRGDSLGELFDRWIVFFDDEQRPISPDLINKLCIVALQDGRVLVKKIARNARGSYDLLSNTEKPIKDAQIKWAARVKQMAPR